MSSAEVVPSDSRYIPFTQQKYCCVPTCLQMIMYRHGIPLIPVEVLGDELGLVVPAEDERLFWNPRTGEMPPAGWGTRIGHRDFEPNAAFARLGLPLVMTFSLIDQFGSAAEIVAYLREIESHDGDVIINFENSLLINPQIPSGHAVIFDRVRGDKIRLINPARNEAKWCEVAAEDLFAAMKAHGAEKSGGFWRVTPVL